MAFPAKAWKATTATAAAWERFAAGEATVSDVRPEVLQSWHRCRDRYRVDPARTHAPAAGNDVSLGPEQNVLAAELGAAAAAVATRAKGERVAVAAGDGEGRVLGGWGDGDTLNRARVQNFGPTFVWSEAMAGTSAIGTALATSQFVEIDRFEHWCSGFHRYSCAAASIRDPATAEPVGTISITVYDRPLPARAGSWLTDASTMLETRLRARAARASAELVAAYQARPRVRFGLAALDTGGRIVAADDAAQAALADPDGSVRRLVRAVVKRARTEPGWIGAAGLGSGAVIELEPVYSAQHHVIGILAAIAEPGDPSFRPELVAHGRLAGTLEDRVVLVADEEVRFVEIVDGVVWLDSDRGRLRGSGRSLDEAERALAPRGFLRVNRRTLVNLARVRELRPGFKGGVWVLVDGSSAPIDVARRRVPALRKALLLYPS
jgi:sigma-54 dependent transcriptional regulator, acetoin dehydrogenase operon transcriptional activator AcoR